MNSNPKLSSIFIFKNTLHIHYSRKMGTGSGNTTRKSNIANAEGHQKASKETSLKWTHGCWGSHPIDTPALGSNISRLGCCWYHWDLDVHPTWIHGPFSLLVGPNTWKSLSDRSKMCGLTLSRALSIAYPGQWGATQKWTVMQLKDICHEHARTLDNGRNILKGSTRVL